MPEVVESRHWIGENADGTRVSFAYDAVGNRTSMADSTGTTTYTYDAVNRLIGKSDPGPQVQTYKYDVAGQRTTLIDPDAGIRTYTYDDDGRNSVLIYANGNRVTNQYDAAARKTTIHPAC